MGDTRFQAPYEQIRQSRDKLAALETMTDEDVVHALAHASRERDPFLANILATESVNRMRRAAAITAHMPEGAFALDDELHLTHVNPALARMLGRPWPELIGLDVLDAWQTFDKDGHPVDAEATPCVVARDHAAPAELRGYVEPPGGSPFPVVIRAMPIVDEGQVVAVVGSVRDATVERLAVERVRSMLDGAPFAAFTLDHKGTFVDVNPAGARLIARSREELLGENFVRYLDPSDAERALDEFARVLAGERREQEYSIRRGDGTTLRTRVTGVPMRAGDAVVGMHGFAEAVVSDNDAWFHALIDAAPVMIWISGADAKRTYFSRGWLAFTGRTMQDELGDGWANGVHPEDMERCVSTYIDHFRPRKPFHVDYRLRRADGGYAWVLDQGVPRYDAQGAFLGFIGSCVDINAQKTLERELDVRVAERTARLSRALRDVETFTTSASHDLRAPLRGVATLLEALVEDHREQMPSAANALVSQARRENTRATTLVQDLLAFTRSGHQELELEEVDVGAICRDVVEELRRRHPEWRTEWEIGPMPPVVADLGLLRVAVHNLLENAAKYSSRRSAPRVAVAAKVHEDDWTLQVEDNGVGFDETQARALFQPFHRLSNAAGYEGTGLGLATVRRVAQRHGGTVGAVGKPGEGATFSLTLPAR